MSVLEKWGGCTRWLQGSLPAWTLHASFFHKRHSEVVSVSALASNWHHCFFFSLMLCFSHFFYDTYILNISIFFLKPHLYPVQGLQLSFALELTECQGSFLIPQIAYNSRHPKPAWSSHHHLSALSWWTWFC